MKIMFGALKEFNDTVMMNARQLGAEGVHFNTPPIAAQDEQYWTVPALQWLKEYAARFELNVEMIENVPIRFYDRILLNLPGRDEQIENYIRTIRNMGKVGIPILGHHFCPTWAWRTSITQPTRGGATVSAWDASVADKRPNAAKQSAQFMAKFGKEVPIPTRDDLWQNFAYFMQAVLPEAERAGVRLVTHPSDPPVPMLAGVARIFISKEDYLRAETITSSDAWGLNLCLGCFSQLGGEPYVLDMIDTFVSRGKVSIVHLRDVQGTIERFQECFLGDGNYDPAKVLTRLKRCGYNGIVIDDHVPFLTDDTRWGRTARAFENGYIQGMKAMLDYLDAQS